MTAQRAVIRLQGLSEIDRLNPPAYIATKQVLG